MRIYYATEDRRLEPSTHARWPTNTFNFSCKGSDSIFWLPQAPKYTQAYMPRCKLKTKINLKKKKKREDLRPVWGTWKDPVSKTDRPQCKVGKHNRDGLSHLKSMATTHACQAY